MNCWTARSAILAAPSISLVSSAATYGLGSVPKPAGSNDGGASSVFSEAQIAACSPFAEGARRETSFLGDASAHEIAASSCSNLPIQPQLQHNVTYPRLPGAELASQFPAMLPFSLASLLCRWPICLALMRIPAAKLLHSIYSSVMLSVWSIKYCMSDRWWEQIAITTAPPCE